MSFALTPAPNTKLIKSYITNLEHNKHGDDKQN